MAWNLAGGVGREDIEWLPAAAVVSRMRAER